MGFSFTSLVDTVYNLIQLRGEYWALDGSQLICARELGIISEIPNISNSEIEDKNKSDFPRQILGSYSCRVSDCTADLEMGGRTSFALIGSCHCGVLIMCSLYLSPLLE